jgi:membrane protein
MSRSRDTRRGDLRAEHREGHGARSGDPRVEQDVAAGRADGRGGDAERPQDIPSAGWKDITLRVKDEIKNDRVPLVSAGVAFYVMLALFPALTALISVYGLVADPRDVQEQIDAFAGTLGGGAGDLIARQASAVAQSGTGALSLGLAVSILVALWAASSGMHGLMQALTLAHDEDETRGLVKRRAIALALTVAGLLVVVVALLMIVVAPLALEVVGLGATGQWVVRILRWPLMAAVVAALLTVVYRYAPDRDKPQWRWVTWGSVIATVLWVVASFGFSFYVANFGNYNETYGALGAVIVLLLWLFISAFVIILGGEINGEMEHQTGHDTTSGEPRPMGQREAHVADDLGERHP